MSGNKRVIFTSLQGSSLVELEWILPVVAGFHDKGYVVEILFERHKDNDRRRMGLNWLGEYAQVRFLDEFGPLGRVQGLIDAVGLIHPFAAKAFTPYTSWGQRHGVKCGIQDWRYTQTLARLKAWFKDALGILAPFQQSPVARLSPAGVMFEAICRSGAPVIWLRNDVNNIALPDHRIPQSQAFTVFNQAEAAIFEAAGLKALITGALRFNQNWLRQVDAYFTDHHPGPLLQHTADTPLALAIAKNEGSPVWRGRDFKAETGAFIRSILDKGFSVVVKPHPNQDVELLRAICAGINGKRTLVDSRPLAFWVPRVGHVFGQLTSGALECSALGVPYDEIDVQHGSQVYSDATRHAVKENLNKWTTSHAISGEAASERLQMFRESFRTDIDPTLAVEMCEAFLVSQSTEQAR